MDDDLRTPGGLTVPAAALVWTFSRSSGPGGQHVNTTSSKVMLAVATDQVTGPRARVDRLVAALGPEVRVTSQTNRSQWRNRQLCLERAAELLDEAARPPAPARRPSKPGRGAVERRLESKRREGAKKEGRRTTEW
jgi:ribosome-associated protein